MSDKVLLVEDDKMLGQSLKECLSKRDFEVAWLESGREVIAQLGRENWKLVILDLGLPDQTGTQVLTNIRRRKMGIPILILTARDSVSDKVSHLELGADDYLVKPFDVEELIARMHVLIRRFFDSHDASVVYKDLVLSLDRPSVSFQNKEVELNKMEHAILKELILNKGKVVTRQKLERTYDLGKYVKSNAIEVHIHHIRTKLYSSLIKTIRGIGYIVEKDV